MPPLIICQPYKKKSSSVSPETTILSGSMLSVKSSAGAISNNGTRFGTTTSSGVFATAYTNQAIAHGKKAYWEVSGNPSDSVYVLVGLMRNNVDITTGTNHRYLPGDPGGLPVGAVAIGVDIGATPSSGAGTAVQAYPNMTTTNTGLKITTVGDVFGFAFDNTVEGKKLFMHKNGVWFGGTGSFDTAVSIVSGIPANDFFPAVTTYLTNVININLGTNAFAHTPPVGYI